MRCKWMKRTLRCGVMQNGAARKAKFVKSVDLYLNRMEKTTLYGGTKELLALSESLKALDYCVHTEL